MAGIATIKPARRARALPVGDEGMALDMGEIKEKVGYMKGKLEAMESRLDQTDIQRDRMESKIDAIPQAIREAVKPLVETADDHAARIAALEKADAAEQGSISMRTKVFAAIVSIGTMLAGIAALFYHPK